MKININQIYYAEDPAQLNQLDPSFTPYYNKDKESILWREFWVFLKEYQKGSHLEADYTGYLSWKFRQKTGIQGSSFLDFIKKNPGYDVYYINPFPCEAINSKNIWYQGERYHPGIIQITERIFSHLNLPDDLLHRVYDGDVILFANYWVGNEFFWNRFMEFCIPIYELIQSEKDPELNRLLFENADQQIISGYIPFIFERLFSTILLYDSDIQSKPMKYAGFPEENRYGIRAPHLRLVYEIKKREEKFNRTGKILEEPLEEYRFKIWHIQRQFMENERGKINEELKRRPWKTISVITKSSIVSQLEKLDQQYRDTLQTHQIVQKIPGRGSLIRSEVKYVLSMIAGRIPGFLFHKVINAFKKIERFIRPGKNKCNPDLIQKNQVKHLYRSLDGYETTVVYFHKKQKDEYNYVVKTLRSLHQSGSGIIYITTEEIDNKDIVKYINVHIQVSNECEKECGWYAGYQELPEYAENFILMDSRLYGPIGSLSDFYQRISERKEKILFATHDRMDRGLPANIFIFFKGSLKKEKILDAWFKNALCNIEKGYEEINGMKALKETMDREKIHYGYLCPLNESIETYAKKYPERHEKQVYLKKFSNKVDVLLCFWNDVLELFPFIKVELIVNNPPRFDQVDRVLKDTLLKKNELITLEEIEKKY